jgi:hypothetical protein
MPARIFLSLTPFRGEDVLFAYAVSAWINVFWALWAYAPILGGLCALV